MTYGLGKDFERTAIALAATSKSFWSRIGSRIQPDELEDPTNKTLLKIARDVAHDHGHPTEFEVVQRAAAWMTEGRATEAEVTAIAELLQMRPDADLDRVVVELRGPVQKRWQQELVRRALDRYKNGSPFGDLVDEMLACDRLGEPVADVMMLGTEIGEDTEHILLSSPVGEHMPLGIAEVDSYLHGGPHRGTVTTILGDSKAGKCHRKGQGILMYDGSIKKVEDVVAGDLVMGPDGTARTVLRTNTGRGQMYRIVPKRGDSWVVNGDHILALQVVRKNGGCPWVWRHEELSVAEWLRKPELFCRNSRLYHSGPLEFGVTKAVLPLEPYFLGLYLGDGTSAGSGCVAITTADPEIVQEVVRQAELFCLDVRPSFNDQKSCPSYYLSRPKGSGGKNVLREVLKGLGLFGLTSGNKYIPQSYKTAPEANRWELLAGLLDTDGHLSKGCTFDYISKSRRLAEDVAFIARSLGLAAWVKPCRKGCQTGAVGTYYRVAIQGDTWKIPVRLPRKKASPKKRAGHDTRRVPFTIEPLADEEDYYGFSLDGDSLYCLSDFTVTHNSMALSFFAAVAAMHGENVGYLALEDQDATYHARIMAALTGVPIFDILGSPAAYKDAKRIWEKMRQGRNLGRIIINTFPPNSLDSEGVRAWFAAKEREKGLRIRFRIIDYGDIVAATGRRDAESKYSHGATVWGMFAALALGDGDPNWVITASQSTRPQWKVGQTIPVLTRSSVADSIHKVRLSNFFISLTPQPDMTASQGYIWYIDSDRHYGRTGAMTSIVPHQRFLGRMADISHLG